LSSAQATEGKEETLTKTYIIQLGSQFLHKELARKKLEL
jgi:hypothetical protein